MSGGKYFLLYADCKTIKELTYEEYVKKSGNSPSLLIAVSDYGLSVLRRDKVLFVGKSQLLRVLVGAGWLKKET